MKIRMRILVGSMILVVSLLCASCNGGKKQTEQTPGQQEIVQPTEVLSCYAHAPMEGWDCDLENHWQQCDCGETLNESAHTVVDFVCTVCGAEIISFYDGTGQLAVYDDKGNCIRYGMYDEDGSRMYGSEYEYSEDGSWMLEKQYEGDHLVAEQKILLEEDMQITLKYVMYNEDGSYAVTEYDRYGNETLEGNYDTAGNAEYERSYINEYDTDGNRTLRLTYENGRLIEEMAFVFGQDEDGNIWSQSGKTTTYHEDGTKTVADGDQAATWSSEITYDADGNVVEDIRYEYLYDENGESVGSKGYRNGALFVEVHNIVDEEGEAIGFLWTDYNEDGTKIVREYNAEFAVVSETTYDADGNVVSE